VHYGQAYVFSGGAGDTGDMPACFRGQSNGLLGAARPGLLFLLTGLHTGEVDFSVNVVDEEPFMDESWEECVEASFEPAVADSRLVDWDGRTVCALPLSVRDYRVRYTARAMDAGHEADTILGREDPVDAYSLSFWPAPSDEDRVVKQTSGIAKYWHDWARSL
jgi:hypothetical protein